MTVALSLLFGGLVGLSLGSLGGGGSIVVVPALVYGLSLDPKAAVVHGLVIVGVTSFFAATFHWRAGQVRVSAALIFALTGAGGAYFGAKAANLVSEIVLITSLGTTMAVAGGLMYRSARGGGSSEVTGTASSTSVGGAVAILLSGVAVGFLTGFLGVGGGFLIVPALTLMARVPIKDAVGTSLVVIGANCASGLFAHKLGAIEPGIVMPFLAASLSASVFAARFASRTPAAKLKRLFAVMVLAAGSAMIAKSLL